tara:strand:- start:2187 stop:3221 length:1035 start_codon:yes stop_codon:yes gene_type:complete
MQKLLQIVPFSIISAFGTFAATPMVANEIRQSDHTGMDSAESLSTADESPEAHSHNSSEPVSFWLDLYRGEPLRFSEVTEDLSQVDIVYVGETHTLDRHHNWQLRIFEDLIQSNGQNLVLALEQIENFQQPDVDRFNSGELDFDGLAEEIDWSTRWRNYEDYRPLLEMAQSNGIPVLALNGRAETIRTIGRKGIEAIGPDEREELPSEIQWDDPDYQQLLNLLMMVHAHMDESLLNRIFAAQVVRDEVMADTLSRFLSDPAHQEFSALVVAGSGHIQYGLGMVQRVRNRLPDRTDRFVLMTVSDELVLSPEQEAIAREISITHEDLRYLNRPKADYLQVSEPRE